ncbi:hypothetical protein EXN19_03630 [Clostridium butyricum]|nr:hypothetical protein [Clostridium butyricum]NFB89678.1 hypothetical protein [Clostridium butyricum]
MNNKQQYKLALRGGLLVNQIANNSDSLVIVTKELKIYKEEELDYYKEKFNYFKKKGRIVNCVFNDLIWTLSETDGGGYKSNRNIKFSINFINKNNIIKAYLINLLINLININTIVERVRVVSDIINISNFFDIDKFNEFEEYIESTFDNNKLNMKDYTMNFISFIRDNVDEEYCNYLVSLPNEYFSKTREIPDYTSILKFDFLLDKYLKNSDEKEFFRYYPIVLWWKICSKIPLRPCEFMILKKDCVYEKNRKYYIRIRRCKPHGFVNKALNIRKEQSFRINKEIYDLVMKVVSHKSHDCEFLLSKNLYNKYYTQYTYKEELVQGRVMRSYNLDKCLKDFYYYEINNKNIQTVISKKDVKESLSQQFYRDCMVSLQLGDARHLAIINLVLQGTNSYLIREMCGHRDINSHLHYIDHAKTYITSKVLVLTDIRKLEIKLANMYSNESFEYGNKRNNKVSNLLYNEYKKVGDIYCKRYVGREEMFPFLCLTDCDECNDKVETDFTGNNDEEIKINKMEIERQFQIIEKYLKDAQFNSIIDSKNERVLFDSQKNIEESANKLNYLISKEAELEAKIFFGGIITKEE